MRCNKIKNKGTNEIYIYFDHPISVPEVVDEEMQAEEIIISDSSSSGDGYETTEDEPYKPPPPKYEETHSSDDSEVHKRKERLKKKKKKMVSPRKRGSQGRAGEVKSGPAGEVKDGPNGEVKSGPNRDLSKDGPIKNRDKPGPSKGSPCYSPKTAKKRASKRYSGRRRKHILMDRKTGAEGAVVDGPEAGGGVKARHGLVGNTMSSSSDIVGEELDLDYDKPYEYESEAFNSLVFDDDENKTTFDAFNEETEYGEVEFKVGQTFITIESFKNALNDYFVYKGKDVMYLKNEKKRVKTLVNKHNCARDFGSNLASREWVTSKLVKTLLTQPELKPKQASDYMIEEYNVHLSEKMISRGLKVTREIVIGNEQAQYGKLCDYLMELHRSNPGSTTIIDVIPHPESLPLFDKLYISSDACKRGLKTGCRPLIGLDECFLKDYYGGQLLSAVGQDANNHFFVIAYAVVPYECKDTWGWFLSILKKDLGDCTELGLNFISDQRKAYFSHGPKVDNITNDICEVWNAKIVEHRVKPILTMCEGLRCYIMRKLATHKKKLEAHIGPLALVQHKKLDQFIKPKSHKWRAIWAGDSERVLFEVHSQNHKVVVNLHKRTCTCNVWQLTGMPCRHAVAALAKMGLKAEDFMHKWLTMESIRATYSHCIKPVNSEEYWTPTNSPRPLPPTIKRAAHRPKMKRRADPVEREMSTTKAKTFVVTCSKCGQTGHYYKTCPNTTQDPNWKPMTKKERRAQKKTTTHKSSTDPATNTAPTPNTDQAARENSNDNPPTFREKQ
ncbi:hypothetical protein Ahy_A06g026767 [Arachis hypogaea]|uniref:SWIM-type domain-containing protein n=1 Tax=Arachis hypogaea TaxID=3818 RepID=A0A445CLJ2_ARAHY|nr:hypothetical protein Ahy_A06g026767 [Arachis hypogaea]